MAKWINAGPEGVFTQPGCTTLRVDNIPLAVCRHAQGLCAIEDVCPHAGMPLHDGEIKGAVLTCPYHGYTFNLANGQNVDSAADQCLRRFPIKCDQGRLWIDVEGTL